MLPDARVRQRDYLLEIAKALTQELDINKLLGRILNISIELLAGQAGLIVLRDERSKWKVSVSEGISQPFMRVLLPYLDRMPKSTENPFEEELRQINELLNELIDSIATGSFSGVGLPLIVRQRIIGVIFIFRTYRVNFSANDRTLLASFADQAAIAVHNAQLYAHIDSERKRLDTLLNAAAEGVLILDRDSVILDCNRAFSQMVGAREADITGKTHDQVIRWYAPPAMPTLEQAEADGWPLTPNATLYVEGDLQKMSGGSIPVGITYAPLTNEANELVSVIATVIDITRFRQADELKSTFISVVSHELKTPVALIKGYVSTLRRGDVKWDAEIVQDSLQVIEEESDRLTELIENLLDTTRLQSGNLRINRAELDLELLVRQTADRLGKQSQKHTITVEFPPQFPTVIGDEDRLQQVISNLLSNALKYTPKGVITVAGTVHPKDVVVCVSDEGDGIAPADVPHIFDRFYRAPESARKTKGAGLGLYLSKSIVEAHGGKIWIDRQRTHGTRICFSLPR